MKLSYNYYPYSPNKHGHVQFGVRDYKAVQQENGILLNASQWFRKEGEFLTKEDLQILKSAFKNVFDNKPKPSMLIIGVADLEEPFTYLSIFNEMKNHQPIESYLDLNCVDLKPKISDSKIDQISYLTKYYDYGYFEDRYGESFPWTSFFGEISSSKKYAILPKITEYLKKVLSDPKKAHWDTDVVDFALNETKKGKEGKYDIISCNFVLDYLKDVKEEKETAFNLVNILNSGGLLIARGPMFRFLIKNNINKNGNTVLQELSPGSGIYRKVSDVRVNNS